jgi:hypothetical protein
VGALVVPRRELHWPLPRNPRQIMQLATTFKPLVVPRIIYSVGDDKVNLENAVRMVFREWKVFR